MGACGVLCGLALLWALGLGQHPTVGLGCGPGRLLVGAGTDARCCRVHPTRCCHADPGKFKFGFTCVDCAWGTFSGGREGHCKPWTDCTQFGFLTVFRGNKTHNAVCVPGRPPAEPPGLLTIVLLAVAACVFLLTSALLGLHVWQLRSQRARPRGTQLPEVPPSPEDASSCQFPEEERGERSAEEKGRLGDLCV
ncbi:tumor necrosis factor receptor superfamily member 18 isoform X2 [Cebus imitator]|uniref:tumor necrosis factor receptor superfamily member 18 isoform X2 n=1 Tax=Cebus imitator TaxID=2715852 RepID=UPI00080A5E3E|nr:tumor necrosis factor receptor superfamily member 18 isoform X2 [Cebus imitator]